MKQNADFAAAHSLLILEHVERDPDVTQADLAARLGVAVGSVNWYVKRLVAKGFIKVAQLQRRRLRYLITPQGISEKTRLALSYMEVSLRTYRELRHESRSLVTEVKARGFTAVRVNGDGDAGEIMRLTCMETGLRVAGSDDAGAWPLLSTSGTRLTVAWPAREGGVSTGVAIAADAAIAAGAAAASVTAKEPFGAVSTPSGAPGRRREWAGQEAGAV